MELIINELNFCDNSVFDMIGYRYSKHESTLSQLRKMYIFVYMRRTAVAMLADIIISDTPDIMKTFTFEKD